MSVLNQIGSVTAMNLRSIPRRMGSSSVIVIGIAGVVGVIVAVFGMTRSLSQALVDTGRPDRAIVLRSGAQNETSSTLLVDAFATLPEEAATLWLVGAVGTDRRYAERVRRRIASPDLVDRVVVRGSVPIEEVGRLYRSADVFALCSFVDAYGTAWAEAIAAGLPVVGWRAGNLPRLAEHDREALMAEPGDLAGLASALRAITTDPHSAITLARESARQDNLPALEEDDRGDGLDGVLDADFAVRVGVHDLRLHGGAPGQHRP